MMKLLLLAAVLSVPGVAGALSCDCGTFCTPMPDTIKSCGACEPVNKCAAGKPKPLTVPRPGVPR